MPVAVPAHLLADHIPAPALVLARPPAAQVPDQALVQARVLQALVRPPAARVLALAHQVAQVPQALVQAPALAQVKWSIKSS
jgi:hypothetical protein